MNAKIRRKLPTNFSEEPKFFDRFVQDLPGNRLSRRSLLFLVHGPGGFCLPSHIVGRRPVHRKRLPESLQAWRPIEKASRGRSCSKCCAPDNSTAAFWLAIACSLSIPWRSTSTRMVKKPAFRRTKSEMISCSCTRGFPAPEGSSACLPSRDREAIAGPAGIVVSYRGAG